MKRLIATSVLVLASVLAPSLVSELSAQQIAPAVAAASSGEIDRDVWNVIIDTVKRDDIVGMGQTYHPDAVLVTPRDTVAIKPTLERWGRDMVANKAKGTTAMVEFRFTSRQDGATTAFESGIFKYTTIDKAGVSTPGYYPFEQLLVKIDGRWRILMERQFAPVTEADWAKLARSPTSSREARRARDTPSRPLGS